MPIQRPSDIQFPIDARRVFTVVAVWIAFIGIRGDARELPRLVVILSVDQLSYEYLERFSENFSEKGIFRRIERDGAWYSQCFHRHAFTLTGPGHAAMTTGTYAYRSGIIDNEWYQPETRSKLNCVEDAKSPIVGVASGETDLKGISPVNLLAPTVGDVLRRSTADQAKVFGVTLKDRSAVLMSGQRPNGVYWLDFKSRQWVTSRYYRDILPDYLRQINKSALITGQAGRVWRLLYRPEQYLKFYPDNSPFEGTGEGLGRSFPHQIASASDPSFVKQVATSPFGNDVTMEVARRLIDAEGLGQDDIPDILNLGISSNDYVGHQYGPNSLEVEDMTYRTDLLIGEFADYLDHRVGAGRWTLFMAADHGIQPIPEYAAIQGAAGKRMPFGELDPFAERLDARLSAKFGALSANSRYVEFVDSHQIFLSGCRPPESAVNCKERRIFVRDQLLQSGLVAVAYTRDELISGKSDLKLSPELTAYLPEGADIFQLMQRSFHQQRSGDVLFALLPFQVQSTTPAMHGSPWKSDAHIPLLALGNGISQGRWSRPTSPASIASTVARLLQIEPPAANEESPLREALGE